MLWVLVSKKKPRCITATWLERTLKTHKSIQASFGRMTKIWDMCYLDSIQEDDDGCPIRRATHHLRQAGSNHHPRRD